jgi:hypothetical protein
MFLYEERGREIARLQKILFEREEKIKQMEISSQKLEAMYTDLKTARTLSLYDKDIKDTKQKLSGLVREIDKCIALLNE